MEVRVSVDGAEGQGGGATAFPVGGGELGSLIRAYDWSATGLGPMALWPQSLKTTVGLLLLSPVPIVLLWGDDGIMIYNDAYSVFAGGRHPKLLGCKVREGWPEVADFNDNVMKVGLAGGTLAYADQELTLFRHDRPEQVWMNLDYSPVLDESGRPAGVIAIVVETTQRILADRRLRESEARFRALTNATSEVIYRMSPDWTEMRLLDGRSSLPDSENPGVYWRNEYIFPEDEATIQSEIDRAVSTGSAFQLEHRVRHADGTVGWTFSRAVPLFGDDGHILEWFGAATDVTERRRTEARREALILLTAEIQGLQDPAGIAYAAAKIIGEALGASRAGYGTIEPAREAIHVERNWTAPGVASLEGLVPLESIATLIGDLRQGRVTAVSDATRDPRTAGAASWLMSLDARAFVNVAVIEKDRLAGVFFVNDSNEREWVREDIDLIREVAARARTAMERRRAEQALQKLANSLELQVEQRTRERDRVWRNTQDLCVVMDRTGVFTSINPASVKILGWTEDEMVGRSAFEFILPEDHEGSRKALSQAAHDALPSFVCRYRCKDGGVRWISWVAAPDGELIYGSGRDITTEREAARALAASEEALRQSQKMEAVGQLTGGLAHDFNNILTGIGGSLELMQTRVTQGRFSELDRYIAAAQSATKRAAALTHRLLAFSRRQTLDPKATNINQLVAGMEDLIRRSVGPEIEIETVAAVGLWNSLVDAGQLENALLNLCLNARDAIVGGGRIVIETGNMWLDDRAAKERDLSPGQYVALSVTDNGTGMPPDVAARAFDPFFTTKPIGQGTGLGLSMIYGFARQSGGGVRIYSELGSGTTVSVYLPRFLGDAHTAEAAAATAEPQRATAGQTALVVDDEPLIRLYVSEILEELGYGALDAPDGGAGLKILRSDSRVDLLITDVGLPNGMNGRQLADAAREIRPALKVLFITGYAENALLNHGHLAPGMQVVTKPFAMETLAMKIRMLLGE
jgi:PAS domain S-box-containing protein